MGIFETISASAVSDEAKREDFISRVKHQFGTVVKESCTGKEATLQASRDWGAAQHLCTDVFIGQLYDADFRTSNGQRYGARALAYSLPRLANWLRRATVGVEMQELELLETKEGLVSFAMSFYQGVRAEDVRADLMN